MYDDGLVRSWRRLGSSKMKVSALTAGVGLFVIGLPALFPGQDAIDGLTRTGLIVFGVIWMGVLALIIVWGVWKTEQMKKGISWECLKCCKELDYDEINEMLRLMKCPHCGEVFDENGTG